MHKKTGKSYSAKLKFQYDSMSFIIRQLVLFARIKSRNSCKYLLNMILMPLLFNFRSPSISPLKPPNRILCTLSIVLIALCTASAYAQRIAPDESWRTLDTEHFRVTFPTHLEDLGRRAAERAEWAHAQLSEQFIAAPRGIIDLVLTDHIDVSNGFASPLPSNRITIYARPPIDSFGLAYFDDWLEHVIAHELTHIFHIDRPGRYGFFRKLFGRVPVFPAIATPLWNIEGIATWYESALTGTGRVHGTFHKMVLRTAALEGRFESIGQAGGNSPQWPGGTRAYAYGSLFFEHLIQKYGRDRLIAFVKAVENQWIPYRLNAAGRSAFGTTLTSEWKAWADTQRTAAAELDTRLARLGAITEPQAITRAARYAYHPKVSPDGKTLYYIRSDGRSDTKLVSDKLDGGGESTVTLISGATFALVPDGDIVFAEFDFAGPHRRFSDLYSVTPGSDVQRITTHARLTAPSASPAGWAVAVAEGGGTSGLARVNLGSGAIEMLVLPDPDIHWAQPAISPDGRWIAATRWTKGHHDIVLLDARGKLVCEVTRDRALDFAPSWSANGQWLVWSSDRSGIPNVLAAKVDNGQVAPPVMLTNLRTGAAYPSVDPSDCWLYFSAYHVNGWEIERIPFNPTAAPAAPRADSTRIEIANRPRGRATGPVRAYAPLETLRPYYWMPIINEPIAVPAHHKGETAIPRTEVLGTAIGARTSGIDLVRRHAYTASARIFLPVKSSSSGRAAGNLSYRYDGLGNPSLGLSLSQNWDEDGARVQQEMDNTFLILERQRSASASMTLVRPKTRSRVSLTVSGGLVREDREALNPDLQTTDRFLLDDPRSTLGELSVRFSATNARSHAFQMGAATGTSFSVRVRRRHDLSPTSNDRSADDLRGSVRTYRRLPLWFPGRQFAAPVLALRASAGASRGPGSDNSYFDIGGAEAITFPVRGYDTSTRSGRHAWSASVEYRAPLALENRGMVALPLHADRIFWTFFADAANIWGSDTSQSRPLLSAGTELITDYYVLYSAIRLRTGVAYRFTDPEGVGYYVRLGTSF